MSTTYPINVSLAVNSGGTIAERQASLAAASLASSATMGGRTAMDYYFVQAFIDNLVDDPLPVLAFLLACQAASTCQYKFQIGT